MPEPQETAEMISDRALKFMVAGSIVTGVASNIWAGLAVILLGLGLIDLVESVSMRIEDALTKKEP